MEDKERTTIEIIEELKKSITELDLEIDDMDKELNKLIEE